MPKFVPKRIEKEAKQWWKKGDHPAVTETVKHLLGTCYIIDTLEGEMAVIPGDWIIEGVEGEFYPCKDSVFRKSYEAVEEGEDGVTTYTFCIACETFGIAFPDDGVCGNCHSKKLLTMKGFVREDFKRQLDRLEKWSKGRNEDIFRLPYRLYSNLGLIEVYIGKGDYAGAIKHIQEEKDACYECFESPKSNLETQQAIDELAEGGGKEFKSADALMDDLND